MKDNIDNLSKTFNKALESAIQEKLKGQAPKDFSNEKPAVKTNAGLLF